MKVNARVRLCPRHHKEFVDKADAKIWYQNEIPVRGALCDWIVEGERGCTDLAEYVVEAIIDVNTKPGKEIKI